MGKYHITLFKPLSHQSGVFTAFKKMQMAKVRAVQQLLARRRSVMDAVGTLCGRCCVHAITGKFDIFRRNSLRPHSVLTGF